jgi:GMP synthase-like glutamine amidotransferase
LGRKIATYTDIQEQSRRKAEAEAARATEELNARLAKEAETGGYEAVKIEAPIAEMVATKTRTDSGSASVKETWIWHVEDFTSLPDEYKLVNEKLLNQVIKAGKHEIPGLRIYAKKKTTIRTR